MGHRHMKSRDDKWVFETPLSIDECNDRLSAVSVSIFRARQTMHQEQFIGRVGYDSFTLSWADVGAPLSFFAPFSGSIKTSGQGCVISGDFRLAPRLVPFACFFAIAYTINVLTLPISVGQQLGWLGWGALTLTALLWLVWKAQDWGKRGFVDLLETTCDSRCIRRPSYAEPPSWGRRPPLLAYLTKVMAFMRPSDRGI